MSRTIGFVACSLLVGCAVDDDTAKTAAPIVTAPGGWSLNGPDLNGINSAATGRGVMLAGVKPTGSQNGSAISISRTGPALSGAGVIGSTWTGVLSNGGTVPLTITAAAQGSGANADVWRYTFTASVGTTSVSLCTDPSGNAIPADAVRGTWNVAEGVAGGGAYDPAATNFTVACYDSAIAKCLELGYKPWTGHSDEAAACVRAVRGDYCGDGESYTVTGVQIGIFDDAGIQADDGWEVDAAWTPDGAACVSKKKATRFDQDARERPSCYPHSVKPKKTCGMDFTSGVAIVTELPPQ
jgi:hypothetical protein